MRVRESACWLPKVHFDDTTDTITKMWASSIFHF
jgi:hypothetical protein